MDREKERTAAITRAKELMHSLPREFQRYMGMLEICSLVTRLPETKEDVDLKFRCKHLFEHLLNAFEDAKITVKEFLDELQRAEANRGKLTAIIRDHQRDGDQGPDQPA